MTWESLARTIRYYLKAGMCFVPWAILHAQRAIPLWVALVLGLGTVYLLLGGREEGS